MWKMIARLSSNQEVDTFGRRLSLFLDYNLLDHAAKFDGFYALDLKEHQEVFTRLYSATNSCAKLQDFLGISHVNNPTNVVDWARGV